VTAAPAVVLRVGLGERAIAQTWRRRRSALATLMVIVIVVLSLFAMPQFNRVADWPAGSALLRDIDRKLSTLEHRPAVVLFRYKPGRDPHSEPIYNADAAWPDDAPVVRARDLGDRNIEIFRYYAARQPRRWFYLYDEADMSLHPLGAAEDLARDYNSAATREGVP
jgi:hypothetical protein